MSLYLALASEMKQAANEWYEEKEVAGLLSEGCICVERLDEIIKAVDYADLIRMNSDLQKLLLEAGWETLRKA